MKRGRPKQQYCINGHDTFIVGRYKDRSCKQCKIEYNINHTKEKSDYNKRYRQEHLDELREYQKEYNEKNKDRIKAARKEYHKLYYLENKDKAKEYYDVHKEEILAYHRQYFKEHIEEIYRKQKIYRDEYPEIHRLANAKNETNRSLRFVMWGQDGIAAFYHNASNNIEVDHYIPLQGDLVSGLNTIWNLQYLTKSQNSSKGNKINLIEASIWYGKLLEEAGLK